MKWNNKIKTAIYIGRFQPFHLGHKTIIEKILKKDKQVAILVMDSKGVGIKNPFGFKKVKKIIDESLLHVKGYYRIFKIPVVSRVVYGRKVGYKINKIKLSKKIEKISATSIRNKIL